MYLYKFFFITQWFSLTHFHFYHGWNTTELAFSLNLFRTAISPTGFLSGRFKQNAHWNILYFQLPIALPVFLLLASLVILALTIYQKPTESGLGVLMMAIGAPLYFIFVYWENKPESITKLLCKYHFWELDTFVHFLPFWQGRQLCDLLLTFLLPIPLWKGVYSKRKAFVRIGKKKQTFF